MIIGIDGDLWCVSDGGCLGDKRSNFAFSTTIRKAVAMYNQQSKSDYVEEAPKSFEHIQDMKVSEYYDLYPRPISRFK